LNLTRIETVKRHMVTTY